MQTRRRLYLILAGLALLAALLWVGFRTEPVPVDLAAVTRGPMQVTVNADGRARIREVFEVSSPIAGTARRSPVQVGDAVIGGQTVVAVVEPGAPALLDARSRIQAEAAVREAEAALRLAESELRQAEEELTYATSQHDRVKALVERGVASVTQLEAAAQLLSIRLATREAADSGVAMATSALDRARAALIAPNGDGEAATVCCVYLRAPIDGTVLSVATVSEHAVAAGAPLAAIGRTDDLEIVADLLSADAVALAPGAKARVERWGGPVALEAELESLEPSARTRVSALGIEEQRVDAVFSLLSPPEARPGLGDGYAVFLRIVSWEAEEAVQVPVSALFRRDGGWAVFVAENGAARAVPVGIGRMNETHAQVTEGLEPGARVVVHPSDAVADGAPIVERTEG